MSLAETLFTLYSAGYIIAIGASFGWAAGRGQLRLLVALRILALGFLWPAIIVLAVVNAIRER